MSIRYMDRVWANKALKGGRLLVMLALADHANDAGECWPSQRHLADKARLTERQVRRVIETLIAEGHLAIAEQGIGRGKKTLYRLFPAPLKADILSDEKADICDTENRTKCPQKTGHLRHIKADICDTKADIRDSAYIEEPSVEPTTTEPPVEPLVGAGAPTEEVSPIWEAWVTSLCWVCHDHKELAMLTEEQRGSLIREARVIRDAGYTLDDLRTWFRDHWKKTMVRPRPHEVRASIPAVRNRHQNYLLDTPNPSPPVADAPPSVPAATPAPDTWSQVRAELCAGVGPDVAEQWAAWLEGSDLVAVDSVVGVPLYQVRLTNVEAVGWVTNRMAIAIRRALSSLIGKRVLVDIVHRESSPAFAGQTEPIIMQPQEDRRESVTA